MLSSDLERGDAEATNGFFNFNPMYVVVRSIVYSPSFTEVNGADAAICSYKRRLLVTSI